MVIYSFISSSLHSFAHLYYLVLLSTNPAKYQGNNEKLSLQTHSIREEILRKSIGFSDQCVKPMLLKSFL